MPVALHTIAHASLAQVEAHGAFGPVVLQPVYEDDAIWLRSHGAHRRGKRRRPHTSLRLHFSLNSCQRRGECRHVKGVALLATFRFACGQGLAMKETSKQRGSRKGTVRSSASGCSCCRLWQRESTAGASSEATQPHPQWIFLSSLASGHHRYATSGKFAARALCCDPAGTDVLGDLSSELAGSWPRDQIIRIARSHAIAWSGSFQAKWTMPVTCKGTSIQFHEKELLACHGRAREVSLPMAQCRKLLDVTSFN